jgi:hypothetical protein
LANALPALEQAAKNDSVAGVKHLRAFLAVQAKSPIKPVSMQGDPVHPGRPGQLMMAAALLKALGADGFVSSVTLDANGTVAEAKGCKVSAVTAKEGGLAFARLDKCLPFPIPEDARPVLRLSPSILELSRYTLKVTGLKDGSYQLKINGNPCAHLTGRELGAGVNLTALGLTLNGKGANPIATQGHSVLNAVEAKEQLVNAWRGLSQRAHASGAAPELKKQLAALTQKVQEADAKIKAAAKPQKLRFELAPLP